MNPKISDNIWNNISSLVEKFDKPRILEWGSGGSTLEFLKLIIQKKEKQGELGTIEQGFSFFQLLEKQILEIMKDHDLSLIKEIDFESPQIKKGLIINKIWDSKMRLLKNLIKTLIRRPYISDMALVNPKNYMNNWFGIWHNPLITVGESGRFIIRGRRLKRFRPVKDKPLQSSNSDNPFFDSFLLHFDSFTDRAIFGRIESKRSNCDGWQQLKFSDNRHILYCIFGLMPLLGINLYNTNSTIKLGENQTIESFHRAQSCLSISIQKIPDRMIPFITTRLKCNQFSFCYEYRPWVNNARGFINIDKPEQAYHLILIDSREPTRMRCVKYARRNNFVAKDGYIVIHDAYRYKNNRILRYWLPGGTWLDGSGQYLSGKQYGQKILNEAYVWRSS